MKLAFVDPSPLDYVIETPRVKPLGGSQSALCYLAEALACLGHEVSLLNRTRAPGRSRGVDCRRLDEVSDAELASRDAVIVLNLSYTDVARRIGKAGSASSVPIFWSQHNFDQPAAGAFADRSFQDSWNQVVLVSDWQAKGYREVFGVRPERIKILGNAIAPAFEGLFPEPRALAAHKPWPPVLCYTSTPFRGLDVLLQAFPRIRAAIPGTRLKVFSSMSVYGASGESDPHRELYERSRALEGVEYVGSISQSALAGELRSATCLAYPNRFAEGFCIAALEAMAAGCVVITSDLGALRETTAEFGHLLPPHAEANVHAEQYAAFAVRVLKEFRSSPAARARLWEQVSAVNRTGTWSVRAKEWEAWLKSLIGNGRVAPSAGPVSLETAAAHFRAGRLDEAEADCRRVLARRPGHAKSLYLLGMIELRRARPHQAVALLREAVRAEPGSAAMHNDLGNAARAAGDAALALESCRRAVELRPEMWEAHNNLGVLWRESGSPEAAESCYRRALELNPEFAEAHRNLGNLRASQGRLLEAADDHRRAAQLRPEFADSLVDLGERLLRAKDVPQALAALRDAVRLNPRSARLHLRLGAACLDAGRPGEAESSYRRALVLDPGLSQASRQLAQLLRAAGRRDELVQVLEAGAKANPHDADLHFQLANAWRDAGKPELAIACYRRAVELQPDYFAAWNNLGAILLGLWNVDEAMAALEAAVRLEPDSAEVLGNLGTGYLYRGQLREAIESYRGTLARNPDLAAAHSNLLLVLNYDDRLSPADLFAEHRRWAERHEAPILRTRDRLRGPQVSRDPGRRLRIGYVSPDFWNHPVARFFEPILDAHDRKAFSVHCYSLAAGRDAMTSRLEALCDGWRDAAGMMDGQLADRIRGDAIDILVDLGGHTRNNRLQVFAHKPAPVQFAFLGYPNTTGLTSIDYVITDSILDPPGEPALYTERPIHLPSGFCPFRPPPNAAPVAPSPASAPAAITFGSVHNFAKLNPSLLDLWCRVLRALPLSRLLIYRHTLTPSMKARVHEMFAARGVPAEQIVLQQALDAEGGFLEGYAGMDILLDAFPFSGHTTTCESLWMGVPVLTLYGDRRAGRMSASVLARVGLDDWIARGADQFVELAVRASLDIGRLAELRRGLRRRMLESVLCDCAGFTRDLESAYRDAWAAWCG